MKNLLRNCCLICLLNTTSLAAQEIDIDVSVTINANRKYIEFWVENFGEEPVFCKSIRQKVSYRDEFNEEIFGRRTVRISNITILPDEVFHESEGGKEIIDYWIAENRHAVIQDYVGNEDYSCEVIPSAAEQYSIIGAIVPMANGLFVLNHPSIPDAEKHRQKGCSLLNEAYLKLQDARKWYSTDPRFPPYLEYIESIKVNNGCHF